jgi:hypothetical protein
MKFCVEINIKVLIYSVYHVLYMLITHTATMKNVWVISEEVNII